MLLDEAEGRGEVAATEALVLRELDFRLEPELGFTLGMEDVDMNPRFLSREEVEAEAAFSEDRRTHMGTLPDASIARDGRRIRVGRSSRGS